MNPIGIPFTAIALLFTLDEGVLLIRARASGSWWRTTGRVLEASGTSGGRMRGGVTLPIVRYEYQVGSGKFEGDRVAFNGHVGIGLREVSKEIGRFSHSEHVDVWYDPAHPERSVLEPGADGWNYICTALGVILTALASSLLWLPR